MEQAQTATIIRDPGLRSIRSVSIAQIYEIARNRIDTITDLQQYGTDVYMVCFIQIRIRIVKQMVI